ncbi:MAG: hypothetical protein K0V04_08095 [Deltaproteobacteria bacterium]|nr:hypothetical protein [Deltaproteobacteria bacterium]
MAHILVYLQRTPGGLHPASAVALCRARDIASDRGATLTAIGSGDIGKLDHGIAIAAGHFGADVLVFGGPHGLAELCEQLNPVHVLVPWTTEGLAAAEGLPSGPPVPRWLTTTQPAWGGADSITAVVAGTLPWHVHEETLEAEYQADVDEVKPPAWVATVEEALGSDDTPPVLTVLGGGAVRWVCSRPVDAQTTAVLERLDAKPASSADEAVESGDTILWLSAEPIPLVLSDRPAHKRLVVIPGAETGLDPTWQAAEWVLPGSRPDALATLVDSPFDRRDG